MNYALRPLRDALSPSAESINVVPTSTYQVAGVYSFGRGLFRREPILGDETRYSSLFRLRAGDFVVSRLKAFEGAVAVVPHDFDGWLVSQEFPTFRPRDGVDPNYLGHLCRWPTFWRGLQATSKGVGARRERVHPQQLLEIRIPLPPTSEQRRLVVRLDRLLGRLRGLRGSVEASQEEAVALRWATLRHEFLTLAEDGPVCALDKVAELNPEAANPLDDGAVFRYIDIGSIENGTGRIMRHTEVPAVDAPSRARRRLRAGDVVISTVRPNLRGSALVPPELDGAIGSTGLAVLRPGPGLNSEFLLLQVLSDPFVDQLSGEARGGHYPAVNDARLRHVQLTVPTEPRQREIVARLRSGLSQIDRLVELRNASAMRLRALEASVLNAAFEGGL